MLLPVLTLDQIKAQYPNFVLWLPNTLIQECPYPSQWGNPKNFSNDPGDPGGKTMDGIIQTEYDTWRVRWGLSRQDVRKSTAQEGDTIYLFSYWLPYCPDLPRGLDGEFFDTSVNEGPGEGVKILQFTLGLDVDGKWGDKTEAAVKGIGNRVPEVITSFAARRHAVYTMTRGYTRFGKDWDRRTTEVRDAALKELAA